MRMVLFGLGAVCATVAVTMGIAGERFWGGQWSGLIVIGVLPALVLWAAALLVPSPEDAPGQ